MLEVDFKGGRFTNVTRGTTQHYTPLDAELRDFIEVGGWKEQFRRRLAAMAAPHE